MSPYLKKILVGVALTGVVIGCILAYKIYAVIFSPNTAFSDEKTYIYIRTGATFATVKAQLAPLLNDESAFEMVARKKEYTANVKAGKYVIRKGMSNNEIVNTLRSGNIPVNVIFNNRENPEALAGGIAKQIEADSLALLNAFKDPQFLREQGFTEDNLLTMYIPDTYQFFWNTGAEAFRERMLKEYRKFWNADRLARAASLNLTQGEVASLAAIVQKETAKPEERPRVAGVYLNRLKDGMLLQADPTVIYALKKHTGNFDTVIRRVLYKDLELDSPYNTYKYAGLPPGPITMPDVASLDAVLQAEKHEYYYFVVDTENPGYHKFARTLAQHNRNKATYTQWLKQQKIFR
ncbi:MAG: endolytic transglycosylase MltG [Sinomicrobium sp.]|nr:endolytic transglycosylase MltG [Sinomicrobium sp.]